MKKFMFAAMAALAITSCSQNEEMDAPSQNVEIGFNTAISRSTRASELVTDGLKTNGGFKVFGYNTDNTDMESTVVLPNLAFMPGVTSVWTTDKWVLDPAGPYYWPVENKVQFFAFSPFADVTYKLPDGTAAGYPSFAYTVKERADQEDLVAAFTKNQTKESNSAGPVSLVFQHVLTQINFALKGKDANFTYTVTDISISGLADKGTFTYANPTTPTTPTTPVGAWSAQTGTASYIYKADDSEFTSVTSPTIATADNALMLMPQKLGADAKITITYSTKYNEGIVFSGTKEVSLKDVVWGAGAKILYTLSLPGGASEITLEPSVGNWNGVTDSSGDKEAI